MGVYETIINEKLLSDSVMSVLLGDASISERKRFFFSRELASMSKKICMFYSALIQIYVSGKAVFSSGAYLDSVNRESVDSIRRCWDVESKFDLGDNETVFSFLTLWAQSGESKILPKSAVPAISSIIYACKKLDGNNRYEAPNIEEKFLDLVRNMPLLSSANFNFENRKISFENDTDFPEVEYSPFIEFWNPSKICSTKAQTNYPMVLTSVQKGSTNNSFSFNYSYLDKYNSDNTQTIGKPFNENEWIRLICNCLGIKAEWYSVNDCYGDFSFLKHITDVTDCVLKKEWHLSDKIHKETDVFKYMKKTFEGSELEAIFDVKTRIPYTLLNNFLYGVFIKFGVFNAFKNIFYEKNSADNKDVLFCNFLECIKNKELAKEEDIVASKKECEQTIEYHLCKLKRFLEPRTRLYKTRSKEIKAEWRAFTVLKLSGMCTDKLFADMENIFSIDDYFEMIKNPITSIHDDVGDVLRFLIEFYSSLENYYNHYGFNLKSYDENKIQALIVEKRTEIASASIEELFEMFVDIVKRSTNSDWVSQVLSRNNICDYNILEEYKKIVLADIKEEKTVAEKSKAKYVFISYKHPKDDQVPDYIEKIQKSYVNCVVDNAALAFGDDWKNWVLETIQNPQCEAVYVFLNKDAILSEAVKYEIGVAYDEAEYRKKNDPDFKFDQFIIPINLEEEELADCLDQAIRKKKNPYAQAIKDALMPATSISVKNKTYVKWSKDADILIKNLVSRVPLPDETGFVMKKHYSKAELNVANFYGFLKYGEKHEFKESNEIDAWFKEQNSSYCVFPMVISVKETQIKRDNITLVGYEIISGSCSNSGDNCFILTSAKLRADEYYCIPNLRTVADDCSWMIEPFLLSQDMFTGKEI